MEYLIGVVVGLFVGLCWAPIAYGRGKLDGMKAIDDVLVATGENLKRASRVLSDTEVAISKSIERSITERETRDLTRGRWN